MTCSINMHTISLPQAAGCTWATDGGIDPNMKHVMQLVWEAARIRCPGSMVRKDGGQHV
jgi:hypothetical protein